MVHKKGKYLTTFVHPHVTSNLYDFLASEEHKRNFEEHLYTSHFKLKSKIQKALSF